MLRKELKKSDELNANVVYKNLKPYIESTDKKLSKLIKKGEKKNIDASYLLRGSKKYREIYLKKIMWNGGDRDKRTTTGRRSIGRSMDEQRKFEKEYKEITKPLRNRVKRIMRSLPPDWKNDPELKNLNTLRIATDAKYDRRKYELEPYKDLNRARKTSDSFGKVMRSLKKLGF